MFFALVDASQIVHLAGHLGCHGILSYFIRVRCIVLVFSFSPGAGVAGGLNCISSETF